MRTICWCRAMTRVLTVVTREASASTPLSPMCAARRHARNATPGSSSLLPRAPTTPNISTCAPSAAMFTATFPAPPRHSLCWTKSTTGPAASGDSRDAVPHRYRSSIRSPSTPIRLPAMRGINRLRFAMEAGFDRAMARSRAKLLRRDLRLLGKHHGDIVANRIDAPARFALQAAFVRLQVDTRFAYWATQNIEQLLWNGHGPLERNITNGFECSRRVLHRQPASEPFCFAELTHYGTNVPLARVHCRVHAAHLFGGNLSRKVG